MKKSLIALAALAAIAGSAQAQSTVTLYGLLDAGIGRFTTNAAVGAVAATSTVPASATSINSQSQTKLDSAALNGNRWGLKGSEDLGGGLSAIFNLESGFSIDSGASGQGGLLFGRRANVGFVGGFGKVELGRNSSSYDDVSADHAMMGQSWFDPSNTNNGNAPAAVTSLITAFSTGTAQQQVGNAAPFLNRTTTWVGFNTRFNNSVKYTSPNISGFTGSVMYALGEDATNSVGSSKTLSANAKYVQGPLLVSLGYQSEAGARTATTEPVLVNTLLNVAYDLGAAKVGFGANRARYAGMISEVAGQNEYNLSVAVPMGATTLSAGYAVSNGDDLGKSSGFGVQALYALSKRTTLYVGGVSTSTYDKLAADVKLAAPTSDIQRNTTYAAGVRHTF